MAIGRMPPSFLLSARSRPPKKNGATAEGHRPAKTTLTKAVKVERKSTPESRHCSKSFKCCGRRPSGPPVEPGGNDKIAFRTEFSSTDSEGRSDGSGMSSFLSVSVGCLA